MRVFVSFEHLFIVLVSTGRSGYAAANIGFILRVEFLDVHTELIFNALSANDCLASNFTSIDFSILLIAVFPYPIFHVDVVFLCSSIHAF